MNQPATQPQGRFARAIACSVDSDGAYQTEIAPDWDIRGNANGGYLLALAANAMRAHCGRSDPISLTAHYLRPGQAGPVSIACETIKEGKTLATVRAELQRQGTPLLALLGAFGDLSQSRADALRQDGEPPKLPPVDACFELSQGGFTPALHSQVEMRLHPEDAGFASGKPSDSARMRGWFRLLDDEPMDTLALLLALDAFPPTAFNANLPVAWTPTVELTAHLRARPVPGWLRASFRTRCVSGGFLEEDGELWDAQGQLVAQSRQLALLPRAN